MGCRTPEADVLKVAEWYSQHLGGQIPIIILSDTLAASLGATAAPSTPPRLNSWGGGEPLDAHKNSTMRQASGKHASGAPPPAGPSFGTPSGHTPWSVHSPSSLSVAYRFAEEGDALLESLLAGGGSPPSAGPLCSALQPPSAVAQSCIEPGQRFAEEGDALLDSLLAGGNGGESSHRPPGAARAQHLPAAGAHLDQFAAEGDALLDALLAGNGDGGCLKPAVPPGDQFAAEGDALLASLMSEDAAGRGVSTTPPAPAAALSVPPPAYDVRGFGLPEAHRLPTPPPATAALTTAAVAVAVSPAVPAVSVDLGGGVCVMSSSAYFPAYWAGCKVVLDRYEALALAHQEEGLVLGSSPGVQRGAPVKPHWGRSALEAGLESGEVLRGLVQMSRRGPWQAVVKVRPHACTCLHLAACQFMFPVS